MPELRLPLECGGSFNFHHNHLGDHVSRVDVYGADGHDLLPIAHREVSQQQSNQSVQLAYLIITIRRHNDNSSMRSQHSRHF